MPTIRSYTDLKDSYSEISEICHETGEPVYITVDGRGDLALVNINDIELMKREAELLVGLNKSLMDIKNGRTRKLDDVLSDSNTN